MRRVRRKAPQVLEYASPRKIRPQLSKAAEFTLIILAIFGVTILLLCVIA
jgi:hypothetical protein